MTAAATPALLSPADRDIAAARRVLRVEGAALLEMADAVDGAFHAAVELLLQARGRIVVSGMGKSGHVGRKIAATFASTGAPSQFVHPAEASHGDLGMVTPQDVGLLISNSGETRELFDLMAHLGRERIPFIGVSSNPESALMRAANVRLSLPKAPEACPMGLAPTTSTTLTLALGDALAVALMERRGLRRENFRTLHPGGTLGALLLKVEDIMHKAAETPLVAAGAGMAAAVAEISARKLGLTGVINTEGALVGVVTDGDLRRNIDGLLQKSIPDVMSRAPKTIRRDAMAAEAVALMNEHKITALFVTDKGEARPVGLIHIHDCLRAGIR